MNILDTNVINHILSNNLTLSEDYYLAPDIVEESDLAQMVHNRRMPNRIIKLSGSSLFDYAGYLDYYNKTLNKYGGRSFYNMTGFGDVSIIASLHVVISYFEQPKQGQLFDTSEQIVVFTNDNGLITKINNEFVGKNVVIKSASDIS